MVRRHQHACQHRIIDGIGQKLAAHIAAAKNGVIHRRPLGIGKSMRRGRIQVFHGFPFWKNGGCLAVQPNDASRPVF